MTTFAEAEKSAEQEKRFVALTSVGAAIFIAAIKLIVGILTHSLGILAEAAHSALDLAAAAVTFFAVRISGRPPDERQMFGYGKVENLSALFEAFLLLVTCIWIIYEAVDRLVYKAVAVDISVWSFLVMLISIAINISRARALMRVAKKHGSQALEADAIHFNTDIWSSWVVIGGLVLVALGDWLKLHTTVSQGVIDWLYRADSIAALGVSGIVIYVTFELGKRTIEGLLDQAPKGIQPMLTAEVAKIPGLWRVRQLRIRPSGPYTFVDMDLEIPRCISFEQAHAISVQAKAIILKMIDRADVVIHFDPVVQNRESIIESVRSVASRNGASAHSIRVHEVGENINVEMHLEVPETLSVGEAHEMATRVETQLHAEVDRLVDVVTHIEPVGDRESFNPANLTENLAIREKVMALSGVVPGVTGCHDVTIYQEDEGCSVQFHCNVSPTIPIGDAHKLTARLERQLRSELPELVRAIIHVEPSDDAAPDPQ
jgi:cation diffusion facilitator family transporter